MHTQHASEAERLKDRFREYFHRAYALRDESAVDEMIHPNVVAYGLGAEPVRGREMFKQWYRALSTSFSGVTCQTTHCFVEGDWATCRIVYEGTHSGAALGPAPTGKKITFSALVLCRVENGKVIEGYNEFDSLPLMRSIGGV